MTDVDSLFPSKFIKAADLDEREHLVTIDRVKIEEVEKDKPGKPVLYFRGAEKGLVLNKTNAQKIASFCGKDIQSWSGKQIVLYPTETLFKGDTVDCVRVRQPKLRQSPPAADFPGDKITSGPISSAKHDEMNPPPDDGFGDSEIPF